MNSIPDECSRTIAALRTEGNGGGALVWLEAASIIEDQVAQLSRLRRECNKFCQESLERGRRINDLHTERVRLYVELSRLRKKCGPSEMIESDYIEDGGENDK